MIETPPPMLKATSSEWKPTKMKKAKKRKSREVKPNLMRNNFTPQVVPDQQVKDLL